MDACKENIRGQTNLTYINITSSKSLKLNRQPVNENKNKILKEITPGSVCFGQGVMNRSYGGMMLEQI